MDMANHTLMILARFITLLPNTLHILAPHHLLLIVKMATTVTTTAVVEEVLEMETPVGVEATMGMTSRVTRNMGKTMSTITSPKLPRKARRRSARQTHWA
jgi:hypothetical protein